MFNPFLIPSDGNRLRITNEFQTKNQVNISNHSEIKW
jgi:hypothetical protein